VKILIKNSKAYFEYHILESFVAGIQLKGSEVKSIKKGDVNISEAYCIIDKGEAFILNMHVSEHKEGGKHNNHEPLRTRKLLLNKKEINGLYADVKQKGLTIIPLQVCTTETGFIKVIIGLCKGKKNYDKRNAIKEKDLERERKNN
jgi:SsrA-binding protein